MVSNHHPTKKMMMRTQVTRKLKQLKMVIHHLNLHPKKEYHLEKHNLISQTILFQKFYISRILATIIDLAQK